MYCKDIAKKYDVTAMQVGRLRKKFFPDHDGGKLTNAEVEVLVDYFEGLDDLSERKKVEEAVKPKFVDGVITYIREGQRRAEVRTKPNLDRVIALLPSPARKDMLLKPIKLEEVEYEDEKFYRCATLAGRAWK